MYGNISGNYFKYFFFNISFLLVKFQIVWEQKAELKMLCLVTKVSRELFYIFKSLFNQ